MAKRSTLAWVCLALAQIALGQDYPARPLRVIVPFPSGGGADLITRVVTQKLTQAWSQPVVVDNRGGAGTLIGTELAARATPDGYTLIVVNPAHAINPGLRSLPYDSIDDFIPVSLIATQPALLVVSPSLPAHTVREFIALARVKPNALSYASAGVGSASHLAAELFASLTGIKVTHVAYKGAAAYMPDLQSGRVQFMFAPMANVLQQARAGRLRAIAVTSAQRAAAVPELPTVADEGVPGYQAMSWYMLLAPAKTPRAIVDKLNAQITKILKLADVEERYAREGAQTAGGTPAEALRFLRSETQLWGRVIRTANIKAE